MRYSESKNQLFVKKTTMPIPGIKNKIFYSLIFLILLISIFGCRSDDKKIPSPENDILVKINKVTITQQEFNDLIKFEANIDPEMDLTAESKKQFLDYLIRKQLMIQEASKLKLDQKEDFSKTIERYWESTLIRNLLEHKTKEFKRKILITDDEIENYYVKNKASFDTPLEISKGTIRTTLESKKLDEMLKEWNSTMRESANIIINNELLREFAVANEKALIALPNK